LTYSSSALAYVRLFPQDMEVMVADPVPFWIFIA
jgi:hypothetical protein